MRLAHSSQLFLECNTDSQFLLFSTRGAGEPVQFTMENNLMTFRFRAFPPNISTQKRMDHGQRLASSFLLWLPVSVPLHRHRRGVAHFLNSYFKLLLIILEFVFYIVIRI